MMIQPCQLLGHRLYLDSCTCIVAFRVPNTIISWLCTASLMNHDFLIKWFLLKEECYWSNNKYGKYKCFYWRLNSSVLLFQLYFNEYVESLSNCYIFLYKGKPIFFFSTCFNFYITLIKHWWSELTFVEH